jgi:hypothetical protein
LFLVLICCRSLADCRNEQKERAGKEDRKKKKTSEGREKYARKEKGRKTL